MDIMVKIIKVNELCKGVTMEGEEFYFKALGFLYKNHPGLSNPQPSSKLGLQTCHLFSNFVEMFYVVILV